jgi:TPR repeat protein
MECLMNLRSVLVIAAVMVCVLGFGQPAAAAPTSQANTAFETGIEAYRTGDVDTAVKAWTISAEGGHPVAAYLLGKLYEQGRGVEKSEYLSYKFYQMAADAGQVQAAVRIGLLYRDGNKELDIKHDYEKALRNFEMGALKAWPESQFYLADMYRRGLGVSIDRSESLRWLILASKKHYVPAYLELARIYFAGEGVLTDRVKGWSYLDLANRFVDPADADAINAAMDKYTKRMKPGEKDAAKKDADTWVALYKPQ